MKNTYIGRTISLGVYLFLLFALFLWTGHWNIENPADMILFSAIAIMVVNLFVVEPFFTKPTDAISASINVALLFVPIYFAKLMDNIFWVVIIYASVVLAISSLAIMLFSPSISANSKINKISNFFKQIAVYIGKSKYIFGTAIMAILFGSYGKSDSLFFFLIIIYLLVLLFDKPRMLLSSLIENLFEYVVGIFINEKNSHEVVGSVAAIQSKYIYIINVLKDSDPSIISPFKWIAVKNIYENVAYECLIVDIYTFENERKMKALKVKVYDTPEKLEGNIAYKISETEAGKAFRENFVGVVIENSDISQIKFEYLSRIFISDGDLLKVVLKDIEGNDFDVLYQVVQAVTNVEYYDNKNEIGLITATAVQLGVWHEKRRNFENYGWVPNINTPVLLAKNIAGPKLEDIEIKIGIIPNTNFSVLVRSDEIITHHLAVLGTTGSGKSVFARKLIKDLSEKGNKIFCLDFTDEIKKYLNVEKLIDEQERFNAGAEISATDRSGKKTTYRMTEKKNDTIASHVKTLVNLRGIDFGRDPAGLDDLVIDLESKVKEQINKFVKNDNNICVVELSELSNTVESLEFTKIFFKALFDLAKDKCFAEKRACIVLEEAHTLIPEWNATGGVDEKVSRRVTNTIAQIALQGRKFNVGMMIIAQRTANVSKTILTQCNTIVSFKQYDETSKDFLSNHFGSTFASNLPMLKNRRAIISGKALVSDVPIIFDVPNIEENSMNSKEQEVDDDCPF